MPALCSFRSFSLRRSNKDSGEVNHFSKMSLVASTEQVCSSIACRPQAGKRNLQLVTTGVTHTYECHYELGRLVATFEISMLVSARRLDYFTFDIYRLFSIVTTDSIVQSSTASSATCDRNFSKVFGSDERKFDERLHSSAVTVADRRSV